MVYVHKRSSPIYKRFNSVVYVLLRDWYAPDIPDRKFIGDTWFAVPAIRKEREDKVFYTLINNNIESIGLMIISEDGRMIRSASNVAETKVTSADLTEIKTQAFNIPEWESLNETPFPYSSMLNTQRIRQRFASTNGDDSSKMFDTSSKNQVFLRLKRKSQRKPCNCGKPVYIG